MGGGGGLSYTARPCLTTTPQKKTTEKKNVKPHSWDSKKKQSKANLCWQTGELAKAAEG
jgi:hypothetical protein